MLISLKYIDFARAKSEAPIKKFIVYKSNKTCNKPTNQLTLANL